MSKKIILKLSMYSDYWGYDENIFKNHVSRYFENDMYEYTELGYTTKIRRVFEYNHTGINAISDIFNKIIDSSYGKDKHIVHEFFGNAIFKINRNKSKIDKDKDTKYSDWYDERGEINLIIFTVDNDAREIKEIIYK